MRLFGTNFKIKVTFKLTNIVIFFLWLKRVGRSGKFMLNVTFQVYGFKW